MFALLRALGFMLGAAIMSLGADPGFGQTGFGEKMPARINYQGTLTSSEGRYTLNTAVRFEFNLPPSQDVFKVFTFPPLPEPVRLPFSIADTVTYNYTIPDNCRAANKPISGSFPYAGSANRIIAALPAAQFVDDVIYLDDPRLPEQQAVFRMEMICDSNGTEISLPLSPPGFGLAGLFFPRPVADRLVDRFSTGSPPKTGTFELDLACPIQREADTQPPVTMLPSEGQPWTILPINNAKNMEELKLLTERSGATFRPPVRGLTILTRSSPAPEDGVKISFDTQEIPTLSARFGGGLCLWLNGLSFQHETAIQIFVAQKYSEGSCQYNAVLEHEQKHRKLFEDALRVSQDYIRGRILNELVLPTKNRPVYATSLDAAHARIAEVLNGVAGEAMKQLRSQIAGEADALDTDEEYGRVTAKCSTW